MKRAIPSPQGNQFEINRAVKENLEVLFGIRSDKIAALSDSASTAEIIAKVNELITRLQQ